MAWLAERTHLVVEAAPLAVEALEERGAALLVELQAEGVELLFLLVVVGVDCRGWGWDGGW